MATAVSTPALPAELSLSFANLCWRYEPFPVGFATSFLDPKNFVRLCQEWPAASLFVPAGTTGGGLRLSAEHERQAMDLFTAGSPVWRHLLQTVMREAFIGFVLDTLRHHQVDLGRLPGQLVCSPRFCMLPASAGFMAPATGSPQTVASLLVFMNAEGDWQLRTGGGLAICKPHDRRRTFNLLNVPLACEEVEVIDTLPYLSNACVVLVKTFNSYHGVMPMTGPAGAWRKWLMLELQTRDGRP